MIKWFAYIVLLLILIPCLSSAKIKVSRHDLIFAKYNLRTDSSNEAFTDTTKTAKQKQQEIDDKKKIKEVSKAKRLPKPEKIDEAGANSQQKAKPKRQRRPPGLERPPEIPRRNN
ncbi:MAG TPA: hypothetical protein VK668_14665 [Mucilaginibacter sp.]|nr:hypothetical protein [Mucilaginibacter sp.]